MDLTGNSIEGTLLPEEICGAPQANILSTRDLGNSDCSCCEQCFAGDVDSDRVCDFLFASNGADMGHNIERIPDEVIAMFLGYAFNSTTYSD
jgi:hypothetical protein